MPTTRANAREAEATSGSAATRTRATAGRQRNTARARAAQGDDRVVNDAAQQGGRARRGNLRRSVSVPNLDEGKIY